jgi:branched-chain amino acid transport system permease protein
MLPVLVDGVNYAAYLFIIATGLTLIYGVMKILNIAHGSLYALGAYLAVSLVGAWLSHNYPIMASYVLLLVAAVLVGLVMGPLIERGLLRFMYDKHEVVLLLVTYAVFLILEDVIKLIWGVESYAIPDPYTALGNFELFGLSYPSYNLLLLAVAAITGVALTWFLQKTRTGKLLTVVIHDREIAAAMGIRVQKYYMLTFTLGAMLAALGGAFTAPTVSVLPGMGAEVIVLAFAVIVIGGLGSLAGAAIGALIVGIVRSAAVHYWPEVELFSIYFVMALVLLLRPKGLFSPPEARKI